MATPTPGNPLPWLFDHLASFGWSAVLYTCYRIVRGTFFAGSLFTIVKERVLQGEDTLRTMATNHLPHLQLELEKQNAHAETTNRLLTELRDAIKDSK